MAIGINRRRGRPTKVPYPIQPLRDFEPDGKAIPCSAHQLNPTTHPVDPEMRTADHFSSWFTKRESAGLRPYYFELNILDVNNRHAEPSIAYVSTCTTWFYEVT
jgi:hypothetical protein